MVGLGRVAHPEKETEDEEREHVHLDEPPLGERQAASDACDHRGRSTVRW